MMNADPKTTGLDELQLGHLRHFGNLARQLPNDWSLMKGRSTGQYDFGGYRFQIAYMLYVLAITHLFRLPAAPGLFKPIYVRLFEKLMLPEVWMYWHEVSIGGAVFNQDVSDTLKEEWDPIVRNNIHFKAYVHSLSLLFNYLFDDDRYAKPGALTFKFFSFFWGGPAKVFAYDQNSLNEHIYWEMAENGFLGVACEPNCIFQICNQPAILGFRLHDLLTGGSRSSDVIKSYEAAWTDFGRLGENGHYTTMILQDKRFAQPNEEKTPWIDAWCGTLMNMWNRDFVRSHYPKQIDDLTIEGPDGTISVRSPGWPEAYGEQVVADDCDFGWVAAWASEMGDSERLEGLLRHADRFMNPTGRDGGLYYPRNDEMTDKDGNRTLMDPQTGNVLLGLSRLNLPDGFHRLFNDPLPRGFFTDPALVRVDDDIDVSRAVFDDGILDFSLTRLEELEKSGRVVIGRLDAQRPWVLSRGGRDLAQGKGLSIQSKTCQGVHVEDGGIMITCPAGGPHDFKMRFA